MKGSKNVIFRFIIFAFAVIFANLSVDSGQHGYEPGFDHSNEIESLVELVLEVGLDISQAIPESGTPEGDNSITKANFFDWYYEHSYYSEASSRPLLRSSIFAIYTGPHIREPVSEVIPPPPRV